jgi:hypothetical protein
MAPKKGSFAGGVGGGDDENYAGILGELNIPLRTARS